MTDLIFYILSILLVLIVALNLVASYIVTKTYFVVKNRRLHQLLFIWFIPLVGGILAILINREDYFTQRFIAKHGNNTSISNSEAINHAIGADHHGGR